MTVATLIHSSDSLHLIGSRHLADIKDDRPIAYSIIRKPTNIMESDIVADDTIGEHRLGEAHGEGEAVGGEGIGGIRAQIGRAPERALAHISRREIRLDKNPIPVLGPITERAQLRDFGSREVAIQRSVDRRHRQKEKYIIETRKEKKVYIRKKKSIFAKRKKQTMRRYVATILLVMMQIVAVRGQSELPQAYRDYIELSGSESGIVEEELYDIYERHRQHPINVNDTNSEEIETLIFLSPFQRAALKAHIAIYGPLLSMEELYLIKGYDSTTVALLEPIAEAKPIVTREKIRFKDIFRQLRHNLVIGGNGTAERAKGYKTGAYEGDRQRLYFRYRLSYRNHIELQFSGDKDPGEALFAKSQKQGFDFYGYYLMVRDIGILRRAIVGQYHLQFGQGLTLWTGFAPYSNVGGSSYRLGQGIRGASAFAEYGYLNGVAATVEIYRNIELTAFYAYTERDATVPQSLLGKREDGYEMVQSLYESGYHRTATEIGKKGQLGEQLWGGNLQYKGRNLRVGITAYKMLLNKKIVPGNYRYNYYYYRGYHNYDIGIDAAYRWQNVILYGEISMSENKKIAGLIGGDWLISSDHRIGLSYRNYAAQYWNLHSAGVGQNEGTRNEQGISVNVSSKTPIGIEVLATLDAARFGEMKYNIYGPSNGYKGQIRLKRGVTRHTQATLQYQYRWQGKNEKEGDDYRVGSEQRHQVQADIAYSRSGWHTKLRAAYSRYSNSAEERGHGIMVYQEVRYEPERVPLSITMQVGGFDITDYEARIYSMESGISYDNSSQQYQNRGWRGYVSVHYDIATWLRVSAKYSITWYTDRETQGSGNDAIASPHRQQLKIQMRWKF